MEITADVTKIKELKDYFFIVPDYQREYVWKPDDQVEQFIHDIENEYDPNPKTQKSYFLGSIIIVKNKEGKFDVIDGQQRLTTIIIALCAFRNLLEDQAKINKLSHTNSEYLKTAKELLYEFNIENDSMQSRMELQYKDSKGYLETLINGEPFIKDKSESIKKMDSAYIKLSNHFKGYLGDDADVDSLVSYLRYFLLKIELVVIESEDLGSALKIFETINQRGSGLNAMDLVKNLIFSKTDEKDFSTVKNIWKEITKQLENCNEKKPLRFLRYFLISRYHDGVIREDDLYKWIISPEGKQKIKYEAQPVAFANELHLASQRYSKLISATEAYTKVSENLPHVTHIGFINKQKSRHHLILLMALNDTFKEADLDYLAQQIESFYFFTNIMRVQSKYNENKFSNWAKLLRSATDLEDIKKIVNDSIYKNLCESYTNIVSSFKVRLDYEVHPLYRLRFILGRLENRVRVEAGLPIQTVSFFDQMQIEHILPQTPKDGKIPEAYENQQDYWSDVHSLGNVTLLESTINQAINNYNDLMGTWYSDKYGEYSNSNILLTQMMNPNFSIGKRTGPNKFIDDNQYKFETWKSAEIEKRKNILLNLAKRTWKVNGLEIKPIEVENLVEQS